MHIGCFEGLPSGAQCGFFKTVRGARDIDITALTTESKRSLMQRMVLHCGSLPGTLGQKMMERGQLQALIDQLEWETSRRGDNNGQGRLPAAMITFTAAIYHWVTLNRFFHSYSFSISGYVCLCVLLCLVLVLRVNDALLR